MNRTVVIVGAGPAGLTLACELGLAGIHTIVLERLAEPTEQSRAMALLTRSVEVFAQRGLTDWLQDVPALSTNNFAFYRLRTPDDQGSSRRVPQWRTEQVLSERAEELGADLRRGHEVTGFDQDESGVTVHVRTPDGDTRLRCAYLVGCDGGDSTVRDTARIDFPGTESTAYGITGEVLLGDDTLPRKLDLRLYPAGMFGVLPMDSDSEWVRLTSVEFDAGTMPDRDIPVTAEEFHAQLHRLTGMDLDITDARWMSRFGNATRLATQYREGRVFLAGDAAHVHFPISGQGMNVGIQDAANLGWKLAAELNGWAPPGLLDTYHAERHPVGRRACMNTQAQMSLIHPRDKLAPLREIFAELIKDDNVNRHLMRMVTAVDIRYPIGDTHPLIGCRVPDTTLHTANGTTTVARTLHSGRGVVLDLTGDTPDLTGWADRVDHVRAEPTDDLTTTVLIRPDGHAAWAGTDHDGLTIALTAWFGHPTEESR